MRDKEIKALRFVGEYVERTGICPSMREVAKHLGMKSTSTIHAVITKLRDAGYLSSYENTPRSIRLTDKGLEQIAGEDFYYINYRGDFIRKLDQYILELNRISGSEKELSEIVETFICGRIPFVHLIESGDWDNLRHELADYIKRNTRK